MSEADNSAESNEAPAQSHADRVGKAGPAQTDDAGHGVKVKVWSRSGRNGDYKQVQMEQSFKPADGEPKRTDLPMVVFLEVNLPPRLGTP